MSVRTDTQERDPAQSGNHRITGVLLVAVIGFAVQQTAIVPAIADVQTSLHASSEWSAWLVTVYLIVATVATLAMGRLADLHGRRRLLLIGLAVFAAASVGAALAPNIAVLIAFRALQGIGGAVYPLTLSVARDLVPEGEVTRAITVLTAGFGIGTAIGFVGGGALAQYLSWRLIFVAGAVLVAAAAVLVWHVLPESTQRARGRFDLTGSLVMGASTVALLAGLTLVVPDGWTAPDTVGLLAFGVAGMAAWTLLERRVADPLVDLHVLTERPVLLANLATVGLGWALFSSYLLIPQFARTPQSVGYGLGAGSLRVGLLLLPLAVGQILAARVAGALSRVVSSRLMLAGGLLLVTAAMVVLSLVHGSDTATAVGDFVLGLGAGSALQAGSAVATEGVASDVAAISSALNSTVRRFAGGVGGQVSTVVLAALVLSTSSRPRFAAYVTSYLIGAALCLIAVGGIVVTESLERRS